MAALTSAAEIPPGGEGTIKATINTRGRSGAVAKTVTVETSDGSNQFVRLQLKAKVVVEVGFEPSSINLGQVGRGEEVSKTTAFVTRDPMEVKLSGVTVSEEAEGLTAKLIKVGEQDAVQVTFKGSKLGTIRGRITATTTSQKRPTIDLMVRGLVLGNWEASPRSVGFSEPAEGQPSTQSLQIKARQKTRFRVTKVVDPEQAVTTKITKLPDGSTGVELTLSKVPEKRRGTLQITTNDPEEPSLEVRYFVRQSRSKLPNRPLKALQQDLRQELRPPPED